MTADESGNVGINQAIAIIQDLLDRHFRQHGRVPEVVVAAGGTALAAHGIRRTSFDVDLYMPDVDDDLVAQVQADGVRTYGPAFKLDVTPVNTLWGPLGLRDIEDSPSIATVTAGGTRVEIRAVDPETLYLLKTIAWRDKDIADLDLIAAATTVERIVARCNQTLPWFGDRSRIPEYLDNLVRSLARNYKRPMSEIEALIDMPESVRRKIEQRRRMSDVRAALLLKAAMARHPSSIRPDPDYPSRLTFDSEGVSAAVAEIIVTRPDLVTLVASDILKNQAPEKYAEWLSARQADSETGYGR